MQHSRISGNLNTESDQLGIEVRNLIEEATEGSLVQSPVDGGQSVDVPLKLLQPHVSENVSEAMLVRDV